MRTKDFIKMLQKEDPSGNARLRIDGKTPQYIEHKPGYWDGAYTYMENGKYVYSTKDSKLDISLVGIDEFIEFNYKEGETWDEFKHKITFEFDGYGEDTIKEKKERILKHAKKEFDEWIEIDNEIKNKKKL